MLKRLLPILLGLCSALLLAVPAMATEPIGLERFEVSALNQNGSPDVQAGSHPYAFVTSFLLNGPEEFTEPGQPIDTIPTGGGLKDVRVEYPPGFVGDPGATPTCNYTSFIGKVCPLDTEVGEADTTLIDGTKELTADEGITVSNPVYNLETPGGVAAEFGYIAAGAAPIFIDASVRTGGDYGVSVNVRDIPQIRQVIGSSVTIWGIPCAHTGCLPQVPLLTNPTSCGVPRTATISVDGWAEPGVIASKAAVLPELLGCERLDFSPTINVTPDGTAGSTPTGLSVGVHVPQESTTKPEDLAEADVKDTTVTLPAGVQISPSASDGLQACSNAQIGFEGFKELDDSGVQTPVFSPGAPSCPDASEIATVKIATPLLTHELTGEVYLAAPQNFVGLPENPFSALIAMYLVAEEPETGVLVKLPGKVSADPATGQLTTTFEDTPALPFSELKLEFFGTARAPLTTPALCGTYTTETSFTPWSVEEPANSSEIKHPASSFQITSGPNGAPCSDPLPFTPALASGTTNVDAGSFSELTTTLGREDGNQSIQSVTLHYPPGVSGLLSGVKLCGEAQANDGTCGPESQIGESIVSVGLGNDPFTVVGGKAYITGPYEGAPFGLSIVNPAKAGPYVLQEGRPVVVRAKIEVDPTTAALIVTTNTPGEGYAIPSMIEGIPLQIKHVSVLVNRPDFTINPTNCTPTHVTGTVNSNEGASSPVSIPFQVTNCGDLKFEPKFTASTSGKTSKALGADLITKVTYPNVPQGADADITRVKVDLPKQLPSRLTTLQKACTNAQFERNPAGCPTESKIGYAVVHTPLLPVPLSGPAIFVSHGGEAFPSLTMVLQGDNVTVDLVGTTNISKAGITSTTFKTLPDSPFSSFELTLPEGKFSALAANGNLCTSKLTIPTEFLSQNGAKINESTSISVTGCAKTATLTRAQKLAKALKACHKKKGSKRARCEAKARKAYGPLKAKKKTKK